MQLAHGQVNGQVVSLSLSGPHLQAPTTADGDGKKATAAKLNPRLFRLVVRNLPFAIKEAAVRGAFERFGRWN